MSLGKNANPIGVNPGRGLGMVPAGDKAANFESVPGKLGHPVSLAKTTCLGIQTI